MATRPDLELDPSLREGLERIREYRKLLAVAERRKHHPGRWYCTREVCDGEPHEGMIRCDHTNPADHKPSCRHARSSQRPPEDWRRVWYVRGGRGSGKTRAGSVALASLIVDHWDEPGEWAVVAPTAGDARTTGMESLTSGLLVALGARVAAGGTLLERGPFIHNYSKTTATLYLKNGGVVFCDGADDGGYRIQGKNLKGLWADEIGLWKGWRAAWDESIRYAVRISPAKIIATGTPKRAMPARELVKRLLDDDVTKGGRTVCTRLRTVENQANLDEETLSDFLAHMGTALERQELEGELLDEVEGALWCIAQLDELRVEKAPEMTRVVVGVDPAGTVDGDTTGIVVVGRDRAGHVYVLADYTGHYSPHAWGQRVAEAAENWKADRIVAERNYGGDMVEEVIRTSGTSVPVRVVNASRAKRVRAEPVAALAGDPARPETWQGRRFHLVGSHRGLEEELINWTPEERNWSPGHLDALVWAVHGLDVLGPDPLHAWLAYAAERVNEATQEPTPAQNGRRVLAR